MKCSCDLTSILILSNVVTQHLARDRKYAGYKFSNRPKSGTQVWRPIYWQRHEGKQRLLNALGIGNYRCKLCGNPNCRYNWTSRSWQTNNQNENIESEEDKQWCQGRPIVDLPLKSFSILATYVYKSKFHDMPSVLNVVHIQYIFEQNNFQGACKEKQSNNRLRLF